MICDFHAHLLDEPGYADALAETAQTLGFDKLCVSGGEARYGLASNEEALAQAKRYPELFVPFAHVRLGVDDAVAVERLRQQGFRGLRVCGPPAPYDAPEFFGLYEAACSLGMPVLFHTGILPPTPLDRALDVRCERMRPVYLDTLARQLPELKIVGTGLGFPWCEEAVATAQAHENVFFDLSAGVLRRRGLGLLRALLSPHEGQMLGQPEAGGAWARIVFGSAVRYGEMAAVERDYRRLFRALALPERIVEAIMGGNAAALLGLQAG